MTKEAENFIIERYQLDKCYRVDTEETRQYMSIDVHNDYEEEYQCYLAGAESREKRIAELEKENAELKEKLEHRNCVDCSNHGSNIKLVKAKKIIKDFLDRVYYEGLSERAEDFIKE